MTLVSFLKGSRVIPVNVISARDSSYGQRLLVKGFARAENSLWLDRVKDSATIFCDSYVMKDDSSLITIDLPVDALGVSVVLLQHPQTNCLEWRILTLPSEGQVADFHDRMPVVVIKEDRNALAKANVLEA